MGKFTRKFISVVIVFSIIFSVLSTSYVSGQNIVFPDLGEVSWAQEAIGYLVNEGVVGGYNDGTFKPLNNITRAEFAKMLVTAFGVYNPSAFSTFTDLSPGAWYIPYVGSAQNEGLAKGSGDGSFSPGSPITREEMFIFCARAINKYYNYQLVSEGSNEIDQILGDYIDGNNVSSWAKVYVATIIKYHLVEGSPVEGGRAIYPKNPITRAEVAVVLFRALTQLTPNESPTPGPNVTPTPEPITFGNLIPLYFDLLDFMRTQSLGKSFVTPETERQRVSNLVLAYWDQIDVSTKNTLISIAQVSLEVKSGYSGLSQSDKTQINALFKQIVLSPTWLYAPLDNPATYTNGSNIAFNYPNNWSGGQTTSNGVGYLFLGKNATQYTWDQIGVSATSPAGSLTALSPITQFEQGKTALQVARDYAQIFITQNAPDMKEINTVDTSLGAAVVLDGHFPGQSEEKFFWLIIIPNGNQFALCRMGGPVSQADELVPAFYNMLNTLNWSTTPVGGGGSGGEAASTWDTAWSRVSTGVVADIWAKD